MVTPSLKLKCNESASRLLGPKFWWLHHRHQAGPDHLQIASGSPVLTVVHTKQMFDTDNYYIQDVGVVMGYYLFPFGL